MWKGAPVWRLIKLGICQKIGVDRNCRKSRKQIEILDNLLDIKITKAIQDRIREREGGKLILIRKLAWTEAMMKPCKWRNKHWSNEQLPLHHMSHATIALYTPLELSYWVFPLGSPTSPNIPHCCANQNVIREGGGITQSSLFGIFPVNWKGGWLPTSSPQLLAGKGHM